MKRNEKMEVLKENISELFEYQNEVLKVYEETLRQHFDFSKTLSLLFDRQLNLLKHDKALPKNILASTAFLQKHNDETQRVSRNFLSQQANFVQLATDLLKKKHLLNKSKRA